MGCDIVSMGDQFLVCQGKYIASEHLNLITHRCSTISHKNESSKIPNFQMLERNVVSMQVCLQLPYNIHIHVLRSSSEIYYNLTLNLGLLCKHLWDSRRMFELRANFIQSFFQTTLTVHSPSPAKQTLALIYFKFYELFFSVQL
jgi:hypothetical protein